MAFQKLVKLPLEGDLLLLDELDDELLLDWLLCFRFFFFFSVKRMLVKECQ